MAPPIRGRERPMRDNRSRSADDDDSDEDEDDDYDPDADEAQADDDGGDQGDPGMAAMVKKAVAAAMAPVKARNRELAAQVRSLQKSMGATDAGDSDDEPEYVESVFTNEELFKGIGNEFGLALAPLIARLEALEENGENIVKAVEEHGVILEGVSDRQEAIQKALSGAPDTETIVKAIEDKQTEDAKTQAAEGQAAPSGAVTAEDVLHKAVEGDTLTGEEREQAISLMAQANTLLREHDIMPQGYESAVDAMNAGGFTRSTLNALRKGVEVADEESQRLVKA